MNTLVHSWLHYILVIKSSFKINVHGPHPTIMGQVGKDCRCKTLWSVFGESRWLIDRLTTRNRRFLRTFLPASLTISNKPQQRSLAPHFRQLCDTVPLTCPISPPSQLGHSSQHTIWSYCRASRTTERNTATCWTDRCGRSRHYPKNYHTTTCYPSHTSTSNGISRNTSTPPPQPEAKKALRTRNGTVGFIIRHLQRLINVGGCRNVVLSHMCVLYSNC